MGHAPSAEVQRRTSSNKLVKSRTSSGAAAIGLSSPSGYVDPEDDRFPSTPGLVGGLPYSSSRLYFPVPPVPSPSPSAVPFPQFDSDAALPIPPLHLGTETPPVDRRDSISSTQHRKERVMSIFRSKSSSARSSRHEQPERRNTTVAAVSPSLPLPPIEGQGQAPTRHNSVALRASRENSYHDLRNIDSWHMGDPRMTWHYDLTSYEAKRLLNMVQEPATPYEETSARSENRFSVISEATRRSLNPGQPESGSGGASITRANSDLSLYTPVRRRSIYQTPGVATRRNTTQGPGTAASSRLSHPPTPSLSRQASFESNGSRLQSIPSVPPRLGAPDDVLGPVTPCEGDYQTIGAFKLGTLRIMNGTVSPIAASPEPDESHMIKRPGLPQTTVRQGPDHSAQRSSAGAKAARVKGRRDVNLKIETKVPTTAQKPPEVVVQMAEFQQSPAALTASPESDSPNRLQVVGLQGGVISPKGEYLAEMQFSPFSLAGKLPASPLETTSKHNAVEDKLFDEEDSRLEYSTVEVLDLRLDPSAKSGPAKKDSPQPIVRSITRSDSGFVSSSPSSEHPYKPLSKTDSGYSSNVSLRSLRFSSKPPLPDGSRSWVSSEVQQATLSPRADGFSGDLKLSGPIFTTSAEQGAFESASDTSPPPPPPKDFVTSTPTKQSSARTTPIKSKSPDRSQIGVAVTVDTSARRSTTSPLKNARIWNVMSTSPKSPNSIPLSPQSSSSDVSALSIGGGVQRPGRLQRLLSLGGSSRARGPPPVHVTHDADYGDIPSVPPKVQRKLQLHSGQYAMSTKRLALKPQLSRETLKTILSVGSLEARSVEAAHNVAVAGSREAALDPAGISRRHTYTPSSLAQASAAESGVSIPHSIPRKPVRTLSIPRKPVPIRKDGDMQRQTPILAEGKPAVVPAEEASMDPVAAAESEVFNQNAVRKSLSSNLFESTVATSREGSSSTDELFLPPTTRAMSMTAQLERSWVWTPNDVPPPRSVPPSRENSMSPSFPSHLTSDSVSPKDHSTAPPVSMRTRKQGNLRLSPPLQPESMPLARPHSVALSRRASKEEAWQGSEPQEGVQHLGEHLGLVPQTVPLHVERSMMSAVRTASVTIRAPDWQVKTDHDTSRRSSVYQRPEDPLRALTVIASQGPEIQRPSSAQPTPTRLQPPTLRHRASYDEINSYRRHTQDYFPPYQQLQPQHQPAKPSMDPRWQRQSYAPPQQHQYQWQSQQWQPPQWKPQQWQPHPQPQPRRETQWESWEHQLWEESQQWDQQEYGRYPAPHVPRGHRRNNSLSSSGRYGSAGGAPYRILHSYNSPAYRNAPIWG